MFDKPYRTSRYGFFAISYFYTTFTHLSNILNRTMEGINKDQQREELHKAIWAIANDLRGSVDGWDFKQYVLGFMFYRYFSKTNR